MTLDEYLEHYLVWQNMLKFFGEAMGGLVISLLILVLFEKLVTMAVPAENRKAAFRAHTLSAVERFYEVIFSGASILSFLAVYYLIDRFVTAGEFRIFWDKHKDMLLLIMICLSIVLNNLMDRVIIRLKNVNSRERASVRIIGMIYVIMIFLYIKYIYENNNYDGFIMYFLGLMIGRFVYFDASFKDTLKTITEALKQLPLMILGLGYTGFMAYLGFSSKYLKISNGVLVSTFIAHIFMIVAIFIIHHSHVMALIVGKAPAKAKEPHNKQRVKRSGED